MKRANFLFGGLQEISASAQKHHSPIVKHPDAGAEQQRFPDIMSDKESGLAETIAQVEKLLLQFHASDRVERAKARPTAATEDPQRARGRPPPAGVVLRTVHGEIAQ